MILTGTSQGDLSYGDVVEAVPTRNAWRTICLGCAQDIDDRIKPRHVLGVVSSSVCDGEIVEVWRPGRDHDAEPRAT